ncbi:MAG: TetR family transcriptional regulator [Deltaproteobacteria bacterium]|nr:TetR family transcriptional regulator [Deltaproteobacteria bacterium]MBW2395573.1 TetR family transcriptional regulator [Deltaproteobacteria bacterium]
MQQTAPQVPPPRVDRAERTRRRILEAASQCFSSAGYAKCTVEAIAGRAGVSKGIVYHHFNGKEQILERVLGLTLAEWSEVSNLDETLAREAGVLEAIADVQRKAIAFARENPMARSLLQIDHQVLVTVAGSREVRESIERHRQNLVVALRLGIDSGEVRSAIDPERAADILHVHFMGLIDQLLDPKGLEVTAELVDCGLDILFHGMATRPTGQTDGAKP